MDKQIETNVPPSGGKTAVVLRPAGFKKKPAANYFSAKNVQTRNRFAHFAKRPQAVL